MLGYVEDVVAILKAVGKFWRRVVSVRRRAARVRQGRAFTAVCRGVVEGTDEKLRHVMTTEEPFFESVRYFSPMLAVNGIRRIRLIQTR